MARTARNAKLDTRSARTKCEVRREPHWQKISPGCFIGYRRIVDGGTWIARMRGSDGRQHYEAIGAADDMRDADGISSLSFAQAQEKARAFFAQKAKELAGHIEPNDGPYSVEAAVRDYLAHRQRQGSKGVAKDTYAVEARILPTLGSLEATNLTTKHIRGWLDGVARAPKMVRTRKMAPARKTKEFDATDPEEIRKRRSTANRLLTILKAALNHAFAEKRIATDEAWRRVKPFRGADAERVRYLSADECKRLVNACPGDFRALVRGALATGCRYGELSRLKVADFNAQAGTVSILISKSGKVRHVALAGEGQAIFEAMTAGRAGSELVFRRDDGDAWGASHQRRPLIAASGVAKIEPAATFHNLRHTYGSSLAMAGVAMGVIAAQLGHKDTRMTEKHYAHLAPNYVADTIRANLPALGDFDVGNVVGLARGRNVASLENREKARSAG